MSFELHVYGISNVFPPFTRALEKKSVPDFPNRPPRSPSLKFLLPVRSPPPRKPTTIPPTPATRFVTTVPHWMSPALRRQGRSSRARGGRMRWGQTWWYLTRDLGSICSCSCVCIYCDVRLLVKLLTLRIDAAFVCAQNARVPFLDSSTKNVLLGQKR